MLWNRLFHSLTLLRLMSLVTGREKKESTFFFYNWHLGANEIFWNANSSNVVVCQLFSHLNDVQ